MSLKFSTLSLIRVPSTAISICAILLNFAIAPAFAETYFKWQNSDGTWEYGNHPPLGANAIRVKTHHGSSTSPTEEVPEEVSPEKAQAMLNKEMCEKAKANLAALNSDAIIQRLDENGESVTLTDEEREEEKGNAQGAINRFCVGIN